MSSVPESILYEGISVDLLFESTGPKFGDLFLVCGFENPNFPPTSSAYSSVFSASAELGFAQVDDYFGIRAPEGADGDDVIVWLFPLIDGEVVHHQEGPFDGIRLSFNVLRNRPDQAACFIESVMRLADGLSVRAEDSVRKSEVPLGRLRDHLSKDIRAVQEHWGGQGIECGSTEALEVDF